ncbi:hypothetical protein R3P38DRAFT_1669024 [Favolaschia claudopus]|uniref:Nephrocystin 3-like N-terminal domain-containing protein n=1 Tax=Favolaschia claudopus TaxID=2862362 RepID=A0AAW0AF36_9AGAR
MAKMFNFRRRDETNMAPLPKYLSDIKDGFELLLDRTEGFLDGTPFKIPLSAVNTALKLANAISDNKNDLQSLIENLARRLELVNMHLTQTESAEARDRMAIFLRTLKQELDAVVALSNRSMFRRLLKADADAKIVANAFRRIDDHLKDFQLDLTMAIDRKLERNNVEAAMQKLYDASSNEASYDWGDNYDRPSCHPKTRQEYLSQLAEWSQENPPCHPRIFWMRGPAGTGKSAIAQSFCEQLQDKSRIVASFFFKRGHPSRGDVMKVFPTLAYHLSCASLELQYAITNSIREDPAIFSRSLAIQLQKLIISPCQVVTLVFPLTIVIDGLDECKGEASQQSILRTLGNAYNDWKSHLAILIVSRPEAHLRSVFDEPCLRSAQTLEIHGSKHDVRIYLDDEFQRIRANHPCLRTAPLVWPDEELVEHFVCKSSGHFVYASTVVKFIDDQDWNPEERIQLISRIEREPISSASASASPFAALDQLYTGILADVPNKQCLLLILAVIAASIRLAPVHMGQLLELEPTDIQMTLRRLHSLIHVPAIVDTPSLSCDRVTVHHASFLDFLNDSARSTQFHFNSTARHSLALHILKMFREPSEIGSWPEVTHVFWQLDFGFITTTYLSPHIIDSLCQVNLDLVLATTGFRQVANWLTFQNGSVDLTQQWEGCVKIEELQNILDDIIEHRIFEQDIDDLPKSLELLSPTLVQIIQTFILVGSSIWECRLWHFIRTRWVLDCSWEEMQSAITLICSFEDIDTRKLCRNFCSPSWIRELNPHQTLQRLAERCLEICCLPQKNNEGRNFM